MTDTSSCGYCGADFLPVSKIQKFCCKECWYQSTLSRKRKGGRGRHSGRVYQNAPERLSEIREKYRNGVTEDILREWMEAL